MLFDDLTFLIILGVIFKARWHGHSVNNPVFSEITAFWTNLTINAFRRNKILLISFLFFSLIMKSPI